MEEGSFHPIPDNNCGVDRYLRDIPPAHYTIKIESFSALSKLLQDANVPNYESDTFESGGYHWKLSLYPNGNQQSHGEGHVSLYLVIADTDTLPLGWEVYVNFKLFVHDQIQDKYMTIQDANGKVRRYHSLKTEWGFDRLLPLGTFKDATNGYLVHDKCAFGVEVFVIDYWVGRSESVAVLEGMFETKTWKICNFSHLNGFSYCSDVVTLGNRKWKLWLYPRGDERAAGQALSLFIELHDEDSFPRDRKTFAKFRLRVKNQGFGHHADVTGTACFGPQRHCWGSISVLSLARLHDASAGFLVNDTLFIEVQVERISTATSFSE